MILTQTEEAAFVCESSQGAISVLFQIDAKIIKSPQQNSEAGSSRSQQNSLVLQGHIEQAGDRRRDAIDVFRFAQEVIHASAPCFCFTLFS